MTSESPPLLLLQVALDICRGLVFLHSRNILHFDVSGSSGALVLGAGREACLVVTAHCARLPLCPFFRSSLQTSCLTGEAAGGCTQGDAQRRGALALMPANGSRRQHRVIQGQQGLCAFTPGVLSRLATWRRHGNAKIADLGLARIVHPERSAVTGNLGTLDWVRGCLFLGGSLKRMRCRHLSRQTLQTHSDATIHRLACLQAAPEMLLGQRCTEKADVYRQVLGAARVWGAAPP